MALTVAGVALLTDGLQSLALKLPAATPHAPFFRPLFQFASDPLKSGEIAGWMASPKVAARTDDDLTLLLAVRMA